LIQHWGFFWNLVGRGENEKVDKGWGWNDGDGSWINYFGIPNTTQPKDSEKKKILCMCDIISMLNGCKNWVMNRGVINPQIYKMVGKNGGNGGYKTNFIIQFDEKEIHQHQIKYLEMGV